MKQFIHDSGVVFASCLTAKQSGGQAYAEI